MARLDPLLWTSSGVVRAVVPSQTQLEKNLLSSCLRLLADASPCGCTTDISISLLAVNQRPLSPQRLPAALCRAALSEALLQHMAAEFSKPARRSPCSRMIRQSYVTHGGGVTAALVYDIVQSREQQPSLSPSSIDQKQVICSTQTSGQGSIQGHDSVEVT